MLIARPRDQPDAAARGARARALPGVKTRRRCTAALASGERRRALATLPRTAQARSCSARGSRVFAPLPRLALIVVDRRGARRIVQAAGRRPLPRARRLPLWRARERGVPDRAGQRDAVARNVVRAQVGRYRTLCAARRADVRARAAESTLRSGAWPRRARRTSVEPAFARGHRARLARGEQSLRVRQPPRLRAVARLRGVRVGGGMPALQRRLVVHREPRDACAAITAATSERLPRAVPVMRQRRPAAARASARSGSSGARAHVSSSARIARVDRDSTRAQGRFRRTCASGSRPARSTSSSARRCSRRVTTFRGSRWSGVLGADNALYSADFRGHRAAGRAARCRWQAARAAPALPGEVIVQTDFPAHPRVSARWPPHDYRCVCDGAPRPSARLTGLPPCGARSRCSRPKRRAAPTSDALPRTTAARRAQAVLRARQPGVEVYPPVPAALARRAGSSAARCSRRAQRARRCRRFLAAVARGASPRCPATSRALGASTSIPAVSRISRASRARESSVCFRCGRAHESSRYNLANRAPHAA